MSLWHVGLRLYTREQGFVKRPVTVCNASILGRRERYTLIFADRFNKSLQSDPRNWAFSSSQLCFLRVTTRWGLQVNFTIPGPNAKLQVNMHLLHKDQIGTIDFTQL